MPTLILWEQTIFYGCMRYKWRNTLHCIHCNLLNYAHIFPQKMTSGVTANIYTAISDRDVRARIYVSLCPLSSTQGAAARLPSILSDVICKHKHHQYDPPPPIYFLAARWSDDRAWVYRQATDYIAAHAQPAKGIKHGLTPQQATSSKRCIMLRKVQDF